MRASRWLFLIVLLTRLALGESEEELTRELKGYQARLQAVAAQVPGAVTVQQKVKQAQDWRKGVLAVRQSSRNLGPMVADAVKLAAFGFVELRATRSVGDRPCALRLVITAPERQELITSRFSFLQPNQTMDGLLLAGVSPVGPGASLVPVKPPGPATGLEKLRRQRDQAKSQLEAVQELAKNKQELARLRKENAALAKQVHWKTLGPERPEQIAASVAKALPKSLTPGLEQVRFSAGKPERLTLAHQLDWPATRIEVELTGTPPELAAQLSSWESFGLDRPALLESVQMDLQGAKVRLIAFARQTY